MDQAKWQGAWVAGRDVGQAWEVKGQNVTAWDGSAEEKRELIIESPCTVKMQKDVAGGGHESSSYSAVWDGETLYLGMGAAGVKKGDDYIVCAGMETYTLKGGKCSAWREDMMEPGKWTSKDGTCSVAGDTFTIPGDFGATLKIKGNVLLSEQMEGNKAEKAADFAAAKAKITK